jgi:general stress protein CsbA
MKSYYYPIFLVVLAVIALIAMIVIHDQVVESSGKLFAIFSILFPILLIYVFARLAYKNYKIENGEV